MKWSILFNVILIFIFPGTHAIVKKIAPVPVMDHAVMPIDCIDPVPIIPIVCPANEEYTKCGAACQNSCADRTWAARCKSMCTEGCICKKGYLRDTNERCVLVEHCGKCGENEFFDCGSACDTTCATLGEVCPIVNIKCNEMCYCIEGYARDSNNKCIPIKDCLAKQCSANQTLVQCPVACPPEQTCTTYISGKIFSCPPPSQIEGVEKTCIPACECAQGYIRQVRGGDCIAPNDCCEDPNAEIVECPNPCPGGTCESPAFADCKLPCKYRGCQCKNGYVENSEGKCILISQCPFQQCPTNQTLVQCPVACPPEETCSSYISGIVYSCAPPSQIEDGRPPSCTPACQCAQGYLRKVEGGDCIVPNDCCDDPNAEIVDCPNPCPGGTCEAPNFADCKAPCKIRGCQCKNGFVKDSVGKCIALSECKSISCPVNEEYSQCGANICQNTCASPKKSMVCKGTCIAGCICKEGFLRNAENVCVLPENCGGCGGDPNAVFNSCGDPCPKTCNNKDKNLMCKASCIVGGGCKCRTGYVRNYAGKCIKECDCPKCGENEFFNCGSACDTKCATLGEVCPIVNIKCTEMCYCIDGYARDSNNKCIPIKQCPAKSCPPNQTWDPCPLPCPPEDTCDSYVSGIAYACMAPADDSQRVCKPKCKCSPGYIRRKTDGDCIRPNDCCNDPNAELITCPNPCPGGTCDKPEFSPCKAACKYMGCQCKQGYVKDSKGKCILLSSCPKKCGANEVWNPCVPYCTFDLTCERLIDGVIRDCARPPQDWQCSGACQCIDGYVRIDGKCVLKSACCTDPNSELVKCPNPCPGGTCDQPNFTPCKKMCKEWGCQCKKGFVKDKTGKCIPTCACPKKCGNNEVWNPCPVYCTFDKSCDEYFYGWIKDCTTRSPNWSCYDHARCECLPGYVRINGQCVSPKQCCTDPNSELVQCPNPCPGGTCDQPEFQPCKRKCDDWGCQCKKGFVKDKTGKCIPKCACPKKCDTNEIWNPCPKYCTFDKSCDEYFYGWIKDCTTMSPNWSCYDHARCECLPGYVRINGKCVLPCECCTDPNSELVACPNPCPGGTCDQPEFQPCDLKCSDYGCQCKKGFVKDKDGKCVCIDSCPKKCATNETWNPCPEFCTFDKSCEQFFYGWVFECTTPSPTWSCYDDARCECLPGYLRINKQCLLPQECCTDPNSELVQCPNPCPGGTCDQPDFQPCDEKCADWGCQCKKGFVKDKDGKCVCLNSCPKKCGTNEVWNPCPGYCTFEDTCSLLIDGIIPDCAAPPMDWQCTGRCECAKGYVRINDACVDPSNCCTDPNSELVSCPNPCPGGTCDQPEFSLCKIFCKNKGCQCKKGYVKDSKGMCILQSKCRCTDPNSELVKCPNPCPGGTCDQPNFTPCKKMCKEWGCQCKKGFVKDKTGKCIPTCTCPKKCGNNEVWNPCPVYCTFDKSCDEYFYGWIKDCTTRSPNWSCYDHARCECLPGYVRINGQCVSPKQCCTDPNSELVQCPNPCPGGTCDQPEFQPCKRKCDDWGCQCKKGFVKDKTGKCIPKCACPKKCDTNEIWNPCPKYCTFDKSCDEYFYGWIKDCTTMSPNWSCYDHARCECLPGYVRINGKCVLPCECCTDPNSELVACPNPCPGGTCDQPEFQPCDLKCSDYGCQCKKGFVKDKDGKCVCIDSCPKKCATNETWNPCPEFCTFDKSCEQFFYGWVFECTTPSPTWSCYDDARCECLPGYLRINKQCLLPQECCTDPNSELVQCPNPCPGGTCDQPDFQPCDEKCADWGCQCKKGFVKDKDGKCVCLNSCPKKCGTNEVWNPCPGYCTFDDTCSLLIDGIIPDCAAPPMDWQCTGRCECAKGYVRINDACVDPSQCCTDPNAELVSCPNPCPGGTCDQPEFSLCKIFCKNKGCQCKKGYVKDSKGMCILQSKCPKKCGKNEFFDCGSACDRTCATLGEPCNIINKKCVERCYCNKGFARNKNDVCIPVKDCPPKFKCGVNEEYVACPSPCPPEKSCSSHFSGIEPLCPVQLNPEVCNPACRCKSGYLRDDIKKCILPAACCTDPNSELVDNPNCCPGGTCAQPSFTPCKMKCPRRGCQCKLGFLKKSSTDPQCIAKNCCPVIKPTTMKPSGLY